MIYHLYNLLFTLKIYDQVVLVDPQLYKKTIPILISKLNASIDVLRFGCRYHINMFTNTHQRTSPYLQYITFIIHFRPSRHWMSLVKLIYIKWHRFNMRMKEEYWCWLPHFPSSAQPFPRNYLDGCVCVCVCGENPREKAEKRESHGGAKPKWRRRRHHHYRHHRRQDIVKLNLLSTHSMCI